MPELPLEGPVRRFLRVCGKTYSPTDLIDPYSVVSGAKPERKASEHHFFKLSDRRCEDFLRQFTQTGDRLQPEAANKMKEWLGDPGDNKLADWDISRDAPYFGFPIPGTDNQKFFYVWLDAPVGYFGSFRNYFEKKGRSQKEIDEFLRPGSDTEMMHFIGKDILYFHAVSGRRCCSSPATASRRKSSRTAFLTVDGQKMSKSRGTFITAESYLQQGLNPEWLRYYYAAKLNSTMEDIDLSLDDFVARVNSDLIGKYVNIASRSAGFSLEKIRRQTAGVIRFGECFLRRIARQGRPDFRTLRCTRIWQGAQGSHGADGQGQPLRRPELNPGKLLKQPGSEQRLQQVCSDALNMFRLLTVYLKPVLPALAADVEKFPRNRAVWLG